MAEPPITVALRLHPCFGSRALRLRWSPGRYLPDGTYEDWGVNELLHD